MDILKSIKDLKYNNIKIKRIIAFDVDGTVTEPTLEYNAYLKLKGLKPEDLTYEDFTKGVLSKEIIVKGDEFLSVVQDIGSHKNDKLRADIKKYIDKINNNKDTRYMFITNRAEHMEDLTIKQISSLKGINYLGYKLLDNISKVNFLTMIQAQLGYKIDIYLIDDYYRNLIWAEENVDYNITPILITTPSTDTGKEKITLKVDTYTDSLLDKILNI